MKIEQIEINKLKPSEYNPRQWTEKQISDLEASIKEFGIVDPIIVNNAPERKYVVVGGHFRLWVAKKMGYKEVPVVFVNIPDLKKEQELNLRLNKNNGEWDYDLLANLDEELLKDVGFLERELELCGKIVDLDDPENEWSDMPEFKQNDVGAFRQLIINFKSEKNINDFAKLIKQNIRPTTRSIWFPKEKRDIVVNKSYDNK